MSDNNARYVINELLAAIRSLNYQENGRWRSGVHGDSDVTVELDWPVSLAEEWLRQTEQKGG